MAKYAILKPICLSGQNRLIGEVIDESLVEKTRIWALKRSGYIAEIDGNTNIDQVPKVETISVPIHCDEDVKNLSITPRELSLALSIVQQVNTKKAVEQINVIDSEEVLIVINALDNRKTVKEAAAGVAKKLNVEESESGEE